MNAIFHYQIEIDFDWFLSHKATEKVDSSNHEHDQKIVIKFPDISDSKTASCSTVKFER
jgi:hypothetical protein